MAQTIKLKRSGTSGATPTTSQLELGEVAINTYDGKMYIKKNVGGTESIVEITGGSGGSSTLGGLSDVTISSVAADQLLQYNGSEWVNVSIEEASAIMKEYQFTATAGQSTFSGSDNNSETLSYTTGAIQVFLNGIFLDSAVDYTATNGTSVVLSETVDANDYLQVVAFKKKIGDGNVSVNTFTGNGSTTAFTLSVDPGDENNTRVFVDGVYQSKSNYSVSGTTLTFSTAPPADTAVEVEIGNRVVTLDTLSNLDLPDNVQLRLGTGQDLKLYHDGSNSYIKDTGTGDLNILSSTTLRLQNASGTNYLYGTNNGEVVLYHNGGPKLYTTASGIQVTGNIANTSGDMTLDVIGDIILDADGGDILLKDGGTFYGFLGKSGNDFVLKSQISDGDFVIKGSDAGSTITALTLDMSAAGTAIFNSHVDLSDSKYLRLGNDADFIIYHDGSTNYVQAIKQDSDIIFRGNDGGTNFNALTLDMSDVGTAHFNGHIRLGDNRTASFGAGYDIEITSDGTHGTIGAPNGNLKLDVASSIILDSDAGNVYLRDHNTDVGLISMANTDLYIRSLVSNRDIIFQGYDAGINITALTLDMSNAGKASFNHDVAVGGSLSITDSGQAQFGTGNDMQIYHNGAVGEINNNTGTFTIDSADDIILDAAGNDVVLKDNGTTFGQLTNDSGNLVIYNSGSQMLKGLGVGSNAQFMGNLGIGASPATGAKLHLSSTAGAPIYIEDSNATSTFNITELSNNGANFGLQTRNSSGTFVSTDYQIVKNANGADYHRWFTAGNNERMRINSSGNVGIGTTSPEQKLHVDGTVKIGDTLILREDGTNDLVQSTGNVLYVKAPEFNFQDNSGNQQFYTTSSRNFIIQNSLGVGTNSLVSGAQLTLGGGSRIAPVSGNGLNLAAGGSDRVFISTGGNVGIGTSSPGRALEVSTDGTAQFRLSRVDSTINGNNTLGTIEFWGTDDTSGTIGATIVGHAASTWGGGAYPTDLRFSTMETSTLSERMRITRLGDVSIGSDHSGFSGWKVLNIRQNSTGGMLNFEEDDGTRSFAFANQGVGMRYQAMITGGYHRFETHALGNGTAMMITDAGNVGIGTQSPAQHFEVNKANARMRLTDGTDQINFGLWDGTNYRLEGDANRKILITSYHTDGIHLGTTGGSHMVVKGGNVSIGADNPLTTGGIAKLSVIGILSFGLTNSDMSYIRRQSAGNYAWQTYDNNNTGSIQLQPYGGNVGIGDTTPDEKLSVYGAVTSSYQAANFAAGPYRANMDIIDASKKVRIGSIEGSNTPTGSQGEVGIYVNSGEKVTIDTSGNVGIGTTAPATGTHTSYQNLVIGETSSSTSGLSFKASTSGQSAIFFSDGVSPFNRGQVLYDHSTDSLTLASNGVEKLRLDGSGQTNVRLGGSTTNGTTLISSCTSTSSSGGAGTGNYLELEAMEPNNPNYGAKKLRLGVQGGGYVKMTMPGAAGLFIESPYQTADKIHVGYAGIQLDMNGGGYGGNQHMLLRCLNDIMFHPGGSERWRMIAPTGSTPSAFVTNQTTVTNIGGTPPDLNSLELGPGYINLNRDDTVSATQIQFGKNGSVAGSIVTTSSTTYNTTSDRRAKENIVDAQDAGELIDDIRVREFDWKNSGEHQRYGMVAQELLEVAPEVVHQPEDEEQMMGVDYSKLVPMLVKALQESRQEINNLKSRVEELESQ